jgi:NADP-dependent 3-hydroxy acid dehydrogenase YdfG
LKRPSLLNIDKDNLLTRAFDISKKEAVLNLLKMLMIILDRWIVINNAGVAITGLTFEELEIEDFDWILYQFMGVVLTSKAFLPSTQKIMKTQHWLIFPVYLDLFRY